jgi:hypothetical protein
MPLGTSIRSLGIIELAPGLGIGWSAVGIAAERALIGNRYDIRYPVRAVAEDDDFRQRGCTSARNKRKGNHQEHMFHGENPNTFKRLRGRQICMRTPLRSPQWALALRYSEDDEALGIDRSGRGRSSIHALREGPQYGATMLREGLPGTGKNRSSTPDQKKGRRLADPCTLTQARAGGRRDRQKSK